MKNNFGDQLKIQKKKGTLNKMEIQWKQSAFETDRILRFVLQKFNLESKKVFQQLETNLQILPKSIQIASITFTFFSTFK